jgi:RHS repeat-associated protein
MGLRSICGRSFARVTTVLAAGLVALGALAQEALPDFYKDPGINPNRDYVNQHVTEHVDPFTGSLQIHSTDVFIPGTGGFDLKVVRSYNSNRVNGTNPADLNTSSLAGMGWTVHFGRVLKNRNTNICLNTNGAVISDNPVIELPDGSRQALAFTASGTPLMLTTQRWKAECRNVGLGGGNGLDVYSPDGIKYEMTWMVTEVAGTSSVYAWYATKISDRNGNNATINYVGLGTPQISNVTTSDGRLITFNYFDSGLSTRRISTIVTGGRIWTYGYQAVAGVLGRYHLTSVTRPDVPATSWQYSYYASTGSDVAPNYQMQRVTYPQGGTITYTYGFHFPEAGTNASRTVVVTTKATSDGGNWTFSYTAGAFNVHDITVVNTPSSGKITYKHFGPNYTSSGSVWKIGLLESKTTEQAGVTVQTENLQWDKQMISAEDNRRDGAFGLRLDNETYAPILTQRTIVRDGVSYTTSFSGHDPSYGNPATVTETGPNGGSRTTYLTYYYNTSLWIVQQVDDETTAGVGSVVRDWDTNGRLTSETRDGVNTSYSYYPTTGDIFTVTRPRGLVSRFTNHWRGIPQREEHPEGVIITRVVSDAGNVTSETNGELHKTDFGYDDLNRPKQITPPLGDGSTISYTATTKTATRGTLQQITTYDGFGRAINSRTDGLDTASGYDSLGRRTYQSIVGYPGIGHSYQFDVLNRVKQITHSADNSNRQFTYSSNGGVPTVAVRDERGNVTTHYYRAYGDPDQTLLMRIVAPEPTANVTITRNGRGLVESAVQGDTTFTRTFAYDTNKGYYLKSTTHPEIGTTTYGRDDAGNMTSKQVGSSGTANYTYDDRNRLKTISYPSSSPSAVTKTYWRTDLLKSVANSTATRTLDYDANQNLKTETLVVDGLTMAATYNYNSRDQLQSIVYPVRGTTVNLNPNTLGLPTQIDVPAGWVLVASYWPSGQIYNTTYNGGASATYGRNMREWINAVTIRSGGDNVLRVNNTMTYDVTGNLETVSDSVDPGYNRNFTYDAINRLTTINGPWGTGLVQYNGAGDITSYRVGSDTKTYGYDANNKRLTSVSSSATGTTNYSYNDPYGNASPTADPYTYDNASNLVTAGAGRTYFYDGANTRVKTVVGGVTTYEFHSAHGLLLTEWRKELCCYDRLSEHLYVTGKRVALQTTDFFLGSPPVGLYWDYYQTDASGSAIAGVNTNGASFIDSYKPYGERLHAAPGESGIWFAGKKQDKPELTYMGGRYYNPQIGRFLSIDPKEADPSDVHGINRYAYANNNPNRFVDPDGHSPVDVLFFAIDAGRLAHAIYTGGDVKGAAIDLAFSTAGVLSPVPGAGQVLKSVRVAEKAVEGARTADRALDAARYTENAAGAAKKIPNPYGKAGGPAHQGKVGEIAADIESRGLTAVREHKVDTPLGTKKTRFVDVVAKDAQGNVVEMHQVGRQTKRGNPVSREVKALNDIQGATGSKPTFHPYN